MHRADPPPQPPGQGVAAADRPLVDVALIVGTIAVYQLGTGILSALVPFRLGGTDAAAALTGFVSSAYSVGFLGGCLVGPWLVATLGPRRLMAASAVAAALVSLALWATPAGPSWAGLRAFAGFASGAYLTLAEAWLADRAPARHRGAAFSAYLTMSRIVFAIGQISLAFAETTAFALFALAAIGYCAGPLVAARVSRPPPAMGQRHFGSLAEVPLRAPVAALAAALHGSTTVSSVSLLPLWGLDHGLTVPAIAAMLMAIQLSGIAFQIPLGILSDRVGRKAVMAIVCAGVAGLSIVAPAAAGWPAALAVPVVGAWGGIAFVLYSLSAALMNDIARPDQRVAWSGSLLVVWGTGASIGPFATSLAMDAWGTGALFAVIGLSSAALLPVLAIARRGPAAQ
jgi:MFS family permease